MKQSNLYTLLFLLFFVSISNVGQAQEKCATDIIHRENLQSDGEYAKRMETYERGLQKMIAKRKDSRGSNPLDTIPVVVHVLHTGQAVGTGFNISDAQIHSAIDQLNAVFADYDGNGSSSTIRFALAKRDPTGCMASDGINRVNATGVENYQNEGIRTDNSRVNLFNLSRWNTQEYFNIWVVSEINNNNGGAGTQGFATFPYSPHQYDGVVCMYNTVGYDPDGSLGYNLKTYTNENDILVHEVGHYLDLYHTFQGDDSNGDGLPDTCPSASGCGADGDCISDTDPHQRTTSVTCLDFALNLCTGDIYGEVVQNYMAYSHEYCKIQFTPEQVGRMEIQMIFGRKGLLASAGLQDIDIDEPPAACIPQTSSLGLTGNYGMGITEISLGNWITYSGNTFEDGGYQDNWCDRIDLEANTLYVYTIETAGNHSELVRFWIDFNNDGNFDNANELIYASPNLGSYFINYFTTPADVLYNTPLRARFRSTRVSTTNDPCYIPTYGQVEDYTVYFQSNAALTATATVLTNIRTPSCCASTAESFTISGTDLVAEVTVSMDNDDFEISKDSINYGNSLLLPVTNDSIENQPAKIYTRLKSGLTEGNYLDTLTVSSTYATDVRIPISGVVADTDGFRGQSFYFTSPANLHLTAENFKGITGSAPRTYEAWINTHRQIASIIANGVSATGEKWVIRLDNGRLRLEIANAYKVGTTMINNSQWHHIAVVLNDVPNATLNDALLYVNGKVETISSSLGINIPINTADTQNLWIGKDHHNNKYLGQLDEIKVWSTARTQTEIREGLHLTLLGNEEGLEAYYQFNSPAALNEVVNGHALESSQAMVLTNSSVDVGYGSSSTVTVAAIGNSNTEINSNNLEIDFADGGTAPNGDLVIYHLENEPANTPATSIDGMHHWVVRNFGSNTNGLNIESASVTLPLNDPVLNYTPYTMSLHGRSSNSSSIWNEVSSLASSADASTGQINFTNINIFNSLGQLAIGSSGVVLPVELSEFHATRRNLEKVHLHWTTLSENNNSHFDIEKSYDGRNFDLIAQVKGMGSTELSNTYYFEDREARALYYRLRQVDLDGEATLSDIRFVPAIPQNSTFTIFPNPTDGVFRISSSLDVSERIEMQIIGLTGRILIEGYGEVSQLNELIARDFGNFQDGVYLVQLKHGGVRSTERLVVNR